MTQGKASHGFQLARRLLLCDQIQGNAAFLCPSLLSQLKECSKLCFSINTVVTIVQGPGLWALLCDEKPAPFLSVHPKTVRSAGVVLQPLTVPSGPEGKDPPLRRAPSLLQRPESYESLRVQIDAVSLDEGRGEDGDGESGVILTLSPYARPFALPKKVRQKL
jgi:hypothetical protein